MVTRRTASTRKAKPAPVDEEIEDLDLDIDDVEEEVEEAPAPKRRAPARKAAAKKAAPVEDDDEEEAPAPKRRGRPKAKPAAAEVDEKPRAAVKRPEVDFGTAQLVELVNTVCGTEYKAYDIRVLLRKMAKNNELDREVGEDRSRYSFSGPKDPIVVAVLKKVKEGAIEESKTEAIDKLKASTASKKATGGTVTSIKKRPGRPKAKPAPVEEEFDDEDVDDLD